MTIPVMSGECNPRGVLVGQPKDWLCGEGVLPPYKTEPAFVISGYFRK